MALEAVATRSLTHGLTVKELVVDQLLQLSTAASQPVAIHEAIKDEIAHPLADVPDDSFSNTRRRKRLCAWPMPLYVRLEELLAPKGAMIQADQADEASEDLGVGPSASEQTGEDYRPVTNWVYRGAMNPEFIRQPDQNERGIGRSETIGGHGTNGERSRRGTGVIYAGSTESRRNAHRNRE